MSANTYVAEWTIEERISVLLAALRLRIRAYVIFYGLAALVLWLIGAFAIGVAIDYLPVLAGIEEMPRTARGLYLATTLLGMAYLMYRCWWQPWQWPLTDNTMALLIERKYPQFRDSLITTVERLARPPVDSLECEFLAETEREADRHLREVQLGAIFDASPLWRVSVPALAAVGLLYAAWFQQPSGFMFAAERLLLQHDQPWPRQAHLEMSDVEVRRLIDGETSELQTLVFQDRVVKVPRGANITLKVKADARQAVVPNQCVLRYRADDGESGRVTLKTIGQPADGWQLYSCDTKPLAGILTSLDFDVTGYDHRLSGYRLEVVDSPTVVQATMDVVYPAYMVDEQRAIYLPRTNEPVLPAGHRFPRGTELVLHFAASKWLRAAEVRLLSPSQPSAEPQLKTLEFDATKGAVAFNVPLGQLLDQQTVEVSLLDLDGIRGERSFRIFLTAVPDEAPRWEIALRGVGNSITPDVRMPLVGRVTDDYGLQSSWLEIQSPEKTTSQPIPLQTGKFDTALDFRELRAAASMTLVPGTKLFVTGKAHDSFNLGGEPNTGASERLAFDVVTPDKLLADLETREIGLRRRLEQVLEELQQMRDSLLRVATVKNASSTELAPLEEDATAEKLDPEKRAARELELRVLRVQRGGQQVKKSTQEVEGIATAFDQIRFELENNRVDTAERKTRLKELIADPLHAIANKEFAELQADLTALEAVLSQPEQFDPTYNRTLTRTNEIIAKLDEVLQKMLKLESYNEIIDLVRDLLRDQQEVRDATKREQRRDLEE